MFHRAKKQFLDLPLAQKFVGIFAVLTLLSGALMIGALHLGLSVFEEKFYEKSLQELDFFVQKVDDDIQGIDTLTRSIAVDSTIQQQMNALSNADPETANYYYLLTGIRPLLLEKIYQDGQISSLQYTDLYGHTLTIGQDMPDPGAARLTALEMSLNQTPGGFTLVSSDSADYPYILCGRRILRSQDMSLKKLGTVVVALNVGKLLDNEIHRLSSKPSELYLYNCQTLVYHSGKAADAVVLPDSAQGYKIQTLSGKKKFICWQTSSLTGLRLCSVFDYHEIYGQINAARNALIFGECAILLLFAWVLLHMARLVTKPIHTLGEAVQTVDQQEGNFAAARALLPKDISADEIGTLTKEFDSMLGKIDTLIHENYEKQILLQETRYKILQSQINPHFLYNTLDSIVWMIEGERYEDAVFMVTQLASLFRISLSRGKTIISMEDELKHARNYMNIQKIRYKNKFTVEFQVEDAILSCCTVKLVIQPLLENAIYYGMESMDGDGEITVVGYRKGDDVYVEVRDNGLGMPDEMVDALLTENNRVRKHGSGVGLINVHNRIRLRFGEPYGLEIDSCLDEGTTVRIHLPYIAYSPENTELLEGGRLKQLKGERQDEEK